MTNWKLWQITEKDETTNDDPRPTPPRNGDLVSILDSFIYDISDARMLYFVQFNPQRSTSLRKRRYGAVVSVYDKSDAERNIGFSNCEFIPNDPADDVI